MLSSWWKTDDCRRKMPKLKRKSTNIKNSQHDHQSNIRTRTSYRGKEESTPANSGKRKKTELDETNLPKRTKQQKNDDIQLQPSNRNKRTTSDAACTIIPSNVGHEDCLPRQVKDVCDQPFSPRRSGRGLVPNRKFQDMEIEYTPLKQKEKGEKQTQSSEKKRPTKRTQNQRKDDLTNTGKESYQGLAIKAPRTLPQSEIKLHTAETLSNSNDNRQCSKETDLVKSKSLKTGKIDENHESLSPKSCVPSDDTYVKNKDDEMEDALEKMPDEDEDDEVETVILNPETGLFVLASTGETVESPHTTYTVNTGESPNTTHIENTGESPNSTHIASTGESPNITHIENIEKSLNTTHTVKTDTESPNTAYTGKIVQSPNPTHTGEIVESPNTTHTQEIEAPNTAHTGQIESPKTTHTGKIESPNTTHTGEVEESPNSTHMVNTEAVVSKVSKNTSNMNATSNEKIVENYNCMESTHNAHNTMINNIDTDPANTQSSAEKDINTKPLNITHTDITVCYGTLKEIVNTTYSESLNKDVTTPERDVVDCSLTEVDTEALEKAVESIKVKPDSETVGHDTVECTQQKEDECDVMSQSEDEVKVAMQSLMENVDDGTVIELVEIPDNESLTVEANLPKLTTPRGTRYVIRGDSQDSVLVIKSGSNVMMGKNTNICKLSEDGKRQDISKQGRVLPAGSSKTHEMQTQTPYNMPNSKRIKIIRGEAPSISVKSTTSHTGSSVSVTSASSHAGPVSVTSATSDDRPPASVTSASLDGGASTSCVREQSEEFVIVELPKGQTVKRRFVKEEPETDSNVPFTIDDNGDHVCGLCSYKTTKKANWYKHKKKHAGHRIHKCPYCDYCSTTSSNLKRHINIHNDVREHKCPCCSLSFRQKIHLERHIKYKHEEKRVQCPLCDYMCANENPDLKIHIRRRHLPQDATEGTIHAFKCEFCDLMTVNKKDLRQHMKFHKHGPELKLFCEFCSFVTDCESRLRRHMLTHTRERPFQCGLCEYRASQKEHVLRHMKSQHNIDVERRGKRVTEDLSESSESRDSSAKQDKQDFSSQEKIFACNHCNMKFSKLLNLYKHLHTQHKNILPSDSEEYLCVVCDFRTSSKKNLLVHMRKHNMQDQLPPSHVFSCVLCRYVNPKRRNLFQHMKKKHGIEIVLKDDGSTSCYISEAPSAVSAETVQSELSVGDNVSSNSEDSQLQVITNEGTGNGGENIISLEDLAYAMSHPKPFGSSGNLIIDEGKDSAKVESKSTSSGHGTDAAEAIEGLQALAEQPGIVPGKPNRPNQVNTTEVSLCQTETEVITMDTTETAAEPTMVGGEEEGLQLSHEQIMHLSSGDFVEINGEMYKVEISHDDQQEHQVIESRIQEATAIDNVIPCSPVISDMMQGVLSQDSMI